MIVPFSLREGYWEEFELTNDDIEFIYNCLLETETPLTSHELIKALVNERIRKAKEDLEQSRTSSGEIFMPKKTYSIGHELVFPAFDWRRGQVTNKRTGQNPDIGQFEVITVTMDNEVHEFATGVIEHKLNEPPKIDTSDPSLDVEHVLDHYGEGMGVILEQALEEKEGFVRIAGRWFPRSLLIDIHAGHLNLADAVLDMAGGGPMSTTDLIKQIDLPRSENSNLVEFSLDLALQEDSRFDEVGPAGQVLWFLNRLEPSQVLETPSFLRYSGFDYDRNTLTREMLELERNLDDELSPVQTFVSNPDHVEIRLIFPHLRSGTLPLSTRIRHFFPTAFEAPRIRFMLIDGQNGEKFPAWVVREKRYIFGLADWYKAHNLIPGSIIRVQRGATPGEVIVHAETRRPTRDWMRTVLVGSDGGVVFAMLKQPVSGPCDDRMSIAVPDIEALDEVWARNQKDHTPFERILVNMVRELARLNPQSHVHASELYAALNMIRRCPPGPILSLLASRPWFKHVGDMHFRFIETENV